MYKIIDSHVHVALNDETSFKKDFTIYKLLKQMDLYGVSKSIIMLNPLLDSYSCGSHLRIVADSVNPNHLIIKCIECNRFIYEGNDPLRSLNIELINVCNKYRDRLIPLVYLHSSNNTIPIEVNFFEKNYTGAYAGYKFNPAQSHKGMNEIDLIHSNKPILIHTGNKEYDHPMHALSYAKKYEGNVILAHACRFNVEILEEVAMSKNIFIDISPFSIMHERRETDLFPPYNSRSLNEDDFIRDLIKLVGVEKILFGSDAPFSVQEKELKNILNNLLFDNLRSKVFSENAKKAFNL